LGFGDQGASATQAISGLTDNAAFGAGHGEYLGTFKDQNIDTAANTAYTFEPLLQPAIGTVNKLFFSQRLLDLI
jgi:hypothetical protein